MKRTNDTTTDFVLDALLESIEEANSETKELVLFFDGSSARVTRKQSMDVCRRRTEKKRPVFVSLLGEEF